MNLDDMIKLAEEHARKILIGTKQELMPTWLLLRTDGEVEVAGTPWTNNEEKGMIVGAMRRMMRQHQIIAYSLLVEAWHASVPADSKDMQGAEYVGVPPSARPDRRESVVAVASNHWGQNKHRQWEIIRDKKGRCSELRRLDGAEDRIHSSRFDDLLDRKGRTN